MSGTGGNGAEQGKAQHPRAHVTAAGLACPGTVMLHHFLGIFTPRKKVKGWIQGKLPNPARVLSTEVHPSALRNAAGISCSTEWELWGEPGAQGVFCPGFPGSGAAPQCGCSRDTSGDKIKHWAGCEHKQTQNLHSLNTASVFGSNTKAWNWQWVHNAQPGEGNSVQPFVQTVFVYQRDNKSILGLGFNFFLKTFLPYPRTPSGCPFSIIPIRSVI